MLYLIFHYQHMPAIKLDIGVFYLSADNIVGLVFQYYAVRTTSLAFHLKYSSMHCFDDQLK